LGIPPRWGGTITVRFVGEFGPGGVARVTYPTATGTAFVDVDTSNWMPTYTPDWVTAGAMTAGTTTAGSTAITTQVPFFIPAWDVGKAITGSGVPGGATIASVQDRCHATL